MVEGGERAALFVERWEEDVRVHVDETGEDKTAGEIVDGCSCGRPIAVGGCDGADASAFDFDSAVGDGDAARDVDDSDVVEDEKGRGKHSFRVQLRLGHDILRSPAVSTPKGP